MRNMLKSSFKATKADAALCLLRLSALESHLYQLYQEQCHYDRLSEAMSASQDFEQHLTLILLLSDFLMTQ